MRRKLLDIALTQGSALRSLGVESELQNSHRHSHRPPPSTATAVSFKPSGLRTPYSTDAKNDQIQGFKNRLHSHKKLHKMKKIVDLKELVSFLYSSSESAGVAWRLGLVEELLERSRVEVEQEELQSLIRVALALLGYAPLFEGKGIRILSIDGGGIRALVPMIILKHLEKHSGVKVQDMFDYVCGTSTGSILASLLFLNRCSLEEALEVYRGLGVEVFNKSNLLGMGQLFLTHAFYDSKVLEKGIRQYKCAEMTMYETASLPYVPKLCFVSTVVNQSVIQPFLFCNYRCHPETHQLDALSWYKRTSDVQVWEGVMASTAAPGYFEEVKLGPYVHQDGALLTNNPCAVAVHEARLLWGRNAPIQSVVSVGTGRYVKPLVAQKNHSTGLKEKLTKIVASATDTESVHTILQDLLPSSCYFRFNPDLSEDIPIDERRAKSLDLLMTDTEKYLNKKEVRERLDQAAACLMEPKTLTQRTHMWLRSKWSAEKQHYYS